MVEGVGGGEYVGNRGKDKRALMTCFYSCGIYFPPMENRRLIHPYPIQVKNSILNPFISCVCTLNKFLMRKKSKFKIF